MGWKIGLTLVFCAQMGAFGQVFVSFFGLDRAHLSYSGASTHTNSQSLQLIRKDGQQVTVIASTTSGSISGKTRQIDLSQQGTMFALRENFTVNGQAQIEDRGGITLQRALSVGGTMLFNDQISFSSNDTNTLLGAASPYGPLQIPEDIELTLTGIPGGVGTDIRVTGGLTLDSCRHLGLTWVGVSGAVPMIVQNSQLEGFEVYGSDSGALRLQSSSFTGSVQIKLSNLEVSDCLFAGDATFQPLGNCAMTGNEFRGDKVVLYTSAPISTFQNNVVAGVLRLCPTETGNPYWPTISQNHFVGKNLESGGFSLQISDISGIPNAYSSQPLALAGNYWGGTRGPLCQTAFTRPIWLAAYGPGICYNLNSTNGALPSGKFRVSSVTDKRPFPRVFAEGRCGQGLVTWESGTLGAAYARQGRDTAVCYDLRTTEQSLTANFYLVCNGQRLDPLAGSAFTVKGDYGSDNSSASDLNRTLNFIIPASLTETNQLALELWMDARKVSDYATPGALVELDALTVQLKPHFARKLRIGVMPVSIDISGFKAKVDGRSAKSIGSVGNVIRHLREGLETRWPLRARDYDVVQLSTYNYEGGFLGKWWVGLTYVGFMNNLSSELSICFLANYNDSLADTEKLDFLLAVLPGNSLGGADGASMTGRRQVGMVDEWTPNAALHELGHALGLYTGQEQYDQAEILRDGEGNRIVAKKGAVIEALTAFIPDSRCSSAIVPQRLRHFALDNTEGVYDVMGSQSSFWITPATLTKVYSALQGLLGTTNIDVMPKVSAVNALKSSGEPGHRAPKYSPPAPGFRRVAFMGIQQMSKLGPPYNQATYQLLPQTLVCRDTTLEKWPTRVANYSTFQQIRILDSEGNFLTSFQAHYRDTSSYIPGGTWVTPNYVEWLEIVDIPQEGAIYELYDSVSRATVFAVTNSNQVLDNHLTAPDPAPTQGQISVGWNASGNDVTHTLYYQTNSGPWHTMGGVQGLNQVTVSTDFLPVSNDVSLKVITADGFTSHADSVSGLHISNRPPAVAIQWPVSGAVSSTNVLWTFRGDADDLEDGALDGSWTSSIDGILGTANNLQEVVLSPGTHTITFQAKDSGGLSSSTNVVVTVAPMAASDLSIPPEALSCRELGSDPMVLATNLTYGGTNLLTLTLVNNGSSNAALANLYIQASGQAEYLADSVQINEWAPFDTVVLSARLTPVAQGTYQVRAQITALGLPDPNQANNSRSWLLTNNPPVAFGARLEVPVNSKGTFRLRALDPNKDPLDFTITAQPTAGKLAKSGEDWVFTSGNVPGIDTFRYRVSDGLLVSSEATVTIIISGAGASSSNAPAPVIYSALQASTAAAKPFSYQVMASNNPVWFDAQGLPSGVSIDHNSGLISGTPTQGGSFTISLQATNSAGIGTATLILQVSQNFANWASGYGLTGAAASTLADPDRDGINNAMEYAFGLNPTVANRTGMVTAWSANGFGGIRYRRLKGGTGMPGMIYVVNDLIYAVEWCNSLSGTWNRGTTFLAGRTIDNGDGTETVFEQAPDAIPNMATFYRLKIQTMPPPP